jgi:glycosyltransferase involved in cell wall biosynthesis
VRRIGLTPTPPRLPVSNGDRLRIGLLAPPWLPVPPIGYGGTEAVVDRLARGFQQAGHHVVLFAAPGSSCPVDARSVASFETRPLGAAVTEVRHVLAAYESFADCDIVHDHTLAGLLESTRYPTVPTVTTCHGPFAGDLRDIYSRVSRRLSIIAISHAQARQAPEIPVAAVIHHGLDIEEFPAGSGSGGYLLFLGRMSPEKGAHRAIEIAARAGMPLVLAAKMREPAEQQYFDDFVRPKLGHGAEYVGEVAGAEKLRLLGDASALLNPIRWAEPFGLVMVEALACGTPVLTHPVGAAPEIVDHAQTGFLCQTDDELATAAPRVSELDRSQCRAAVGRRFSTEQMVDKHLSLFDELLGSATASQSFHAAAAAARQ